jgi:hypothetical protein
VASIFDRTDTARIAAVERGFELEGSGHTKAYVMLHALAQRELSERAETAVPFDGID